MLRQFSTQRILGFFLLDWLGTLAMLWAATWLRSWLGGLPVWFVLLLRALQIEVTARWSSSANDLGLPVFIVVALIWPFFFFVFSIYDGRRNETLKNELLNVFMAICVSIATLAGLLFFSYRGTPRVLVIIFFLLDVILLSGYRIVFWGYRRFFTVRKGKGRRIALVIGAGQVGRKAVEQLQKYAWADLELIGFLDDDKLKQGQVFHGLPVLGNLDEAPRILAEYQVQDAVVALPLRAHKRLIRVCHSLQQQMVRVHVIPDLFALSFPNAALDGYGGIPVIDLGRPGIQGVRRILKRAFDVVAVTIGLLLLSPLITMITLAIALDSPGPVIFKQQRIGENGRLFTMYKFRSMRVDADPQIHKEHVSQLILKNLTPEQFLGDGNGSLKLENDPRVTRIGHFLRKTSLDELPQLFNVLRGEMSLVGPRPPLPYEVDLYRDWHKRRFEAPPGMTGLWQVKGRNRVSFDEMVRMDLDYIERQSLWLDLNIILQTPLALISARGAG